MFKIYKKVGKDLYDFTDFCGPIILRSTSEEISEELNFSVKGTQLTESDIILLYEDTKKIFEGIIVTVEKDEYTKDIKCFDFGWYLNKNEDVYQFNDSISNCVSKICKDHDITIGNITNIPVLFKDIIRGNLSDIISKLMEYATKNNGIKYIWQMRENKFYLEQENDNVVVYNTKLFQNEIDITKLFKNTKIKRSIENLVNAVKVTNQEDNSINILSTSQDELSIKKYGRIQKLESLEKDEKGNAKNVSTNQLKLLNKVEETVPVELPGIIDCRSNKVLQFNDDIIEIKGKFRVKQCTHNITSISHLMSLDLEVI